MKATPGLVLPRMITRWISLSLVIGTTASFSSAAESLSLPAMGAPIDPAARSLVFSLLPKSLRLSPELDMTVMCELTPYGRTLPQATPENPLRYILTEGSVQQLGEPVNDNNANLPDPVYLNRILTHSLAANGYLPATESSGKPTLVIVSHWGAYYSLMPDKDWGTASLVSSEQRFRGFLERSRLIGSSRYVKQAANQKEFGFVLLDQGFRREFLNYQAENDLYYVLISAYDATALETQNEHRLVWRARLTVNAQAVAMAEALPPLVLTASSVFGRDMNGPEIVMRKLRRGVVTLAPMEILDVGFKDSASRLSN